AHMGLGVVGSLPQRGAKAFHRRLALVLLVQQERMVQVGFRIIRPRLQGLAVAREGVLQLALLLERVPEVVMDLGVAGTDSQRFVVAGNSFLASAELDQDDAEVGAGFGIVAISLERRAVAL